MHVAPWEARFRAARVSLPDWAEDAPDRNAYTSNETGTFELYTWDRRTGEKRQATSRKEGTTDGMLSPDGEKLWWFDDDAGDEFGVWRRQPFAGGGAAVPAAPGVPAGWSAGCEVGRTLAVVGTSTDDGTTVHVVRPDGTSLLYSSADDADVAALSKDDRLVLLEHSEHGDSRHKALRVLTVDGQVVGDLWDGEGLGLHGVEFSPDGSTVLALHEQNGRPEPLLWDLRTGTAERLALDLPGDLSAQLTVDGSALVVVAEAGGRSTLHRVSLTGEVEDLMTSPGSVTDATPRPDRTVEFAWSSAATPAAIRSTDGSVVLTPPGPAAPSSVPVIEVVVEGPGGPVRAFVARPPVEGPVPVLFLVHGGPTWHDSDAFGAERAAWVDLGCAVVQVNYRGSTGYGSAWRDAIEGRPGLTELEDLAAVREWAVTSGLASTCVLAGGSWGGYLTLLGLGTQPELWSAGVAGVPVADYVAAYEDEMEPLRAFDRSLFGGSPQELPELYARCSPITYVDQVRAPVLVLAGANDPRCPIRQIDNWLTAAQTAGKDVQVYRYDAGHGSLVVDEKVRQMRVEMQFVAGRVGLPGPA